MFDDLRAEILKENPSCILVEGGFNARTYSAEDEAKLDGESAFASFVARELKIPCGDIEPSDAETNAYLLKNHSAESILAMYMIRQMHQIRRESENESIDFNDYFLTFLKSDIRDGLPEFELSAKTVADLIEPYVGHRVDQGNWRRVNTYEIIYRDSGKLHRVWQEAYQFRNIHVLELLERLYRSYDHIFIVMGFDHAEDLSPELRRLFKEMG
ncbi:MAG: hypothetical protein OEW18_01565 [Candidatus Aminicenantes bacterium]|nr:hypothetical protein [Candidatus Aminicenantes bacterium]